MTRFIRCSPVDEAAVVDINARELAIGYRRDVAAALPAGLDPPAEFWVELADIVADYFIVAENRSTWSQQDLARLQRIVALIDELNAEIRATDRGPALSQWGLISGRLLSTLWPARAFVETSIAGHQDITTAFHGRGNPHRQIMLYDRLLDLWHRRLEQPLRYRRAETNKGMPGGPLIRFFAACIGPVLGEDAPTLRGIAKIIDRARDPRGIPFKVSPKKS